ncbi:FecR domain-containing protein [Mucilaginibacter sp. Bleaf8]|uniref:FecR family protein n=1 Tax=Mucilaginibacter sp. Bleaf8 TaxID=2834430 RepID=UPI001BCFB7B0|nr:FecR domain-containing protein [Mucilaginibacter sp. Bleaf8]MBS7562805.1 FecR domain-containing protein [Mucilaginibacter sp. Bleaf8]
MANSCTKAEFDELLEMLKQADSFDAFDASMRKSWEEARQTPLLHTVNWNGIYRTAIGNRWLGRHSKFIKYAACIVAILMIGSVILYKKQPVPTVYVTHRVPAAQTKVLVLQDGTRITLNANSELRYPEKFTSNSREVYLKGEAYFQVVHNDNKPFIVRAGKLKTHVLGTSFTVAAYSPQKPMVITVLTGKVAVKDESSKAVAVLTRGQSATSRPGQNKLALGMMADPQDAIAWTEDKLIFENASLEEVATALHNKYGVEVKVADEKLAQQHITAIFQHQHLNNILNVLAKLTHSKYMQKEHAYLLYK